QQSSHILCMTAALTLAVSMIACGTYNGSQQSSDTSSSGSEPCTYCVVEKPNDSVDIPAPTGVRVYPEQLMFYWEINDAADLAPPHAVIVTNYEATPIVVERVYIAASQESHIGRGGANYFSVDAPEGPVVLNPGEQLTLSVAFARSQEQRSAVLL